MATRREFLKGLGIITGAAALSPAISLGESFCPAPKLPQPTITAESFLKKGDTFTIDGFYRINPVTGRPTKDLQTFVVSKVVDSATVTIAPVG